MYKLLGAIERNKTNTITVEMKHVCRMYKMIMIIFYNLIASKINWRLIRFEQQHAVSYVCVNMTLLKATWLLCVRALLCSLLWLDFDRSRHQLNSSNFNIDIADVHACMRVLFCRQHMHGFDRRHFYYNLMGFLFIYLFALLFYNLQASNTCVKIICCKWMPKTLHTFCTKVKVSIKPPSVSCLRNYKCDFFAFWKHKKRLD